jgi:hypothetical protein
MPARDKHSSFLQIFKSTDVKSFITLGPGGGGKGGGGAPGGGGGGQLICPLTRARQLKKSTKVVFML